MVAVTKKKPGTSSAVDDNTAPRTSGQSKHVSSRSRVSTPRSGSTGKTTRTGGSSSKKSRGRYREDAADDASHSSYYDDREEIYDTDNRSSEASDYTGSKRNAKNKSGAKLPSPRKHRSSKSRKSGTSKKTDRKSKYTDANGIMSTGSGSNIAKRVIDADEDEHEKALRALHAKATKCLKDGDYKGSLEIFEDILRSHVKKYGNTHFRVGSALHNIAIVQLRDGNLDDALDAIEEAVRIRTIAFGEESAKVADSLVELGIILLSRKEFHESIEAFNDALEICEAKFGKEDIRVCKILNNIGCIYYEYGDLPAAEKIFLEAIAMQRKLKTDKTSKDKPGALTSMSTLCNIGYVYIDSNQFAKAFEVLEQALAIQIDVLDKGNKLILNTLDNLGYAYAKDGDYDKAVCHYEELLELQTAQLGRHHLDISEALMKLVWAHIKLYEWEEARQKLERVKKIQKANLKRDDKKLAKTDKLLNQVNYQLLKYTSPAEAIAVSLTSSGVRNPFTGRKIDFTFLSPPTEDMRASAGNLKKPHNSSKMSGHKLNYS